MADKMTIPEVLEDDEIIRYLSSRYRRSPREIISRYLDQERKAVAGPPFTLEDNEMTILREMGIRQFLKR